MERNLTQDMAALCVDSQSQTRTVPNDDLPPTSAARRVLAIPELLELILLNVSLRDLHVLQRVCRNFATSTRDTSTLRALMQIDHLSPDKISDHFAATFDKARTLGCEHVFPGTPQTIRLNFSAVEHFCPLLHELYFSHYGAFMPPSDTDRLSFSLSPFSIRDIWLDEGNRTLDLHIDINLSDEGWKPDVGFHGRTKKHLYHHHASWTRLKVTSAPIAVRLFVSAFWRKGLGIGSQEQWNAGDATLGRIAEYLETCLERFREVNGGRLVSAMGWIVSAEEMNS